MVCPGEKWTAAATLSDRPCCDHCCCRHGALPPGVTGAEGGEVAAEPEPADGADGAVTDAGPPPRFGTKSYGRTWVIWFRLVSVTFWKIFLPLCSPSMISNTAST